MIEEQLEAWNKIENKYTREDIENALKSYHYDIIENGNKSFKKLFPEIKENKNNLDKNFAKEKIEEYLKLLDIGIDNHFDLMILNQNDEYPINLDKRGNIHMEPINKKEGRLNMLNEMYELILEKYFSELPKNSILIYPAVGDDMVFCDFAKKYGHRVVCIDGHENIKIPKEILINKDFEDYKKLEKEIKEKGDIQEGDNIIFVFKGFDTINKVTQKEIDKIIDDFDGNQIALFGCESNWAGLGIPKTEGRAFKNLNNNRNFTNSTGEYFSEGSREIMKKVSDASKKLNWRTGFFRQQI